MPKYWRYILLFISLITLTVWLAVLDLSHQKLRIIACDVGQGDAILINYGTKQFLIDGGPGNKIIDCLSKYMPFWDREIEVVFLTHPEKDHFGGLTDVFNHYKVDVFIANAVDAGSKSYEVLKNQVRGEGIRVINPKKGMRIGDSLIYLDILFPSEEFLSSKIENYDSQNNSNVLGAYSGGTQLNQFSIVALLSFKEFNALLTGDISSEISNYIADQLVLNDNREIEYIKIPHHGSRNNLTDKLLSVVNPKIAVISVGKNNSYGHPHAEIIKLLENLGIKTFRTDEVGDVVVETDGNNWWTK